MRCGWALVAAAAVVSGPFGPGRAAASTVVMDQILNPWEYDSSATLGVNASQIYSDFQTFSAMALDDFEVESGDLRLSRLTVLMLAGSGFASFGTVTGYQISIFSDPKLAGASLLGDVASTLIGQGAGVNVTRINGSDLGLVDFDIDIELPEEGTYWLGISVVGSLAGSGQFFIRDNGANGVVDPGGKNGFLANPGEGFERGVLITANTDYAYRITAVPEPSCTMFALLAAPLVLRRRR